MTLKWNRLDKDCLRRKGDSEHESKTDSFNHIRNKMHLNLLEMIIISTHNNRIRNIENSITNSYCQLQGTNMFKIYLISYQNFIHSNKSRVVVFISKPNKWTIWKQVQTSRVNISSFYKCLYYRIYYWYWFSSEIICV